MDSEDLPARVVLAPGYRVRSAGALVVFVVRGLEQAQRVEGGAAAHVLRTVHRPIAVRQLLKTVPGAETQLQAALRGLLGKGYVVDASAEGIPNAGLWHALGVVPAEAQARLAKTKFSVTGDPALGKAIAALGLPQVKDNAALSVFVTDDVLSASWRAINARQRQEGRPWLVVEGSGEGALFGPVFSDGACWQCVTDRLKRNRPVARFLSAESQRSASDQGSASGPLSVGLTSAIALEIAKWAVLKEGSRLAGHLFRIERATPAISSHRVTRRPQCPECGSAELYESAREPITPFLGGPAPSHETSGGTRIRPAAATIREWSSLVDPLLGVVSTVSEVEAADAFPVRVWTATADIGGDGRGDAALSRTLDFRAWGKGSSADEAKASALGEAIERYSAVFQGNEIRRVARLADFPAGDAVHPNDCMLFSRLQQEAGMVRAFDGALPCDWSPLWSIAGDRWVWLPTQYLYFGYPGDDGSSPTSSNGVAAGNSLAEAVVQGFLELIERDAYAIWWYNSISPREVPSEAFGSARLDDRLRAYGQAGRDISFYDITADSGIPTIVAASWRRSGDPQLLFSAGAHFSPVTAALRAIGEVDLQANWLALHGVENSRHRRWLQTSRVDDFAQLRPSGSGPAPTPFALFEPANPVATCLSVARNLRLPLLVLDMTRPDIKVPVARVVAPGLRHYWPHFAPGRLYDVPVALGWRQKPTQEADLAEPPPMILP